MAIAEFTEALRRLTPDDVYAIARSLESDTAGDEVDAWRTTIAIDRALRHSRRTREAARRYFSAFISSRRGVVPIR